MLGGFWVPNVPSLQKFIKKRVFYQPQALKKHFLFSNLLKTIPLYRGLKKKQSLLSSFQIPHSRTKSYSPSKISHFDHFPSLLIHIVFDKPKINIP